jgi:hypothetical protein
MRTLTVLIIVTFVLLSCQKEASSPDNNNTPTDTSALGKFIYATKISDAGVKAAVDSLIIDSRNHGWWNLCTTIYPLVGGTADACKYNLKDPRDVDGAFRITWTGNISFDNSGVQSNGGWGDTHVIPSSALSLSSNHISVYSVTDVYDTASVDIGAEDSHGTFQLAIYSGIPQGFYLSGSLQAYYEPNPGLAGYFLGTRTSANISPAAGAVYRNGIAIQDSTLADADAEGLPNISLDILNKNNYSVHTRGSNRKFAFATIGAGISSEMAVIMYADIQRFQIKLQRAIY